LTTDIPNSSNIIIATYVDGTAILYPENDPLKTSDSLQNHLNVIKIWTFKWRIKINPEKSIHANVTMKKE